MHRLPWQARHRLPSITDLYGDTSGTRSSRYGRLEQQLERLNIDKPV